MKKRYSKWVVREALWATGAQDLAQDLDLDPEEAALWTEVEVP